MLRNDLINYLNELLKPNEVKDYAPNGLQVEGSSKVNKVITGVTASMQLIDEAIKHNADTILVHHGYFWKGESETITGMKYRRIKKLIENNINLIGYHLPLDIHPVYGNNARLGALLNLSMISALDSIQPTGIVMKGQLNNPLTVQEFSKRLETLLNRKPLSISANESLIQRVAWCTGGGQSYIDSALDDNIDAFISGEISEQTTHSAREQKIHYFAAGHHATERYGINALGKHVSDKFDVDVTFVDCENPA